MNDDRAGYQIAERIFLEFPQDQRMTYLEVERLAARTDLALLPVDPPEAHGPHLPVGTATSSAS